MGANPFLPISTALYGFVMLMIFISQSIIRSHTIKQELVHTDEERNVQKKIISISVKGKRQSYISSAMYLISIPLAFVSVYLSYVCFIIPVILFLIPAGIDEESLANKVIEKNG